MYKKIADIVKKVYSVVGFQRTDGGFLVKVDLSKLAQSTHENQCFHFKEGSRLAFSSGTLCLGNGSSYCQRCCYFEEVHDGEAT